MSNGIEIDQVQTEEKAKVEPENPSPEAEPNAELDQELQVKLQPILLDSAINALGNTLEKLTSLEDLNFTEDEHKALVEAWTPLLPSVSPMTNAILVSVIILSGKALLYTAYKRNAKPGETKAPSPETKEIKEAVH